MSVGYRCPQETSIVTCGDRLRILFVPWDRFPPFRPAAKAIFLNELPNRGHQIDWLIQAHDGSVESTVVPISGGFAYVGPTDPGHRILNRLHKHVLNIRHALYMIALARTKQYDVIQAKDNFIAAIVGLTVARRRKIRFFYWIAYPRAEASILEGSTRVGRYPVFYWIRGHVLKVLLYKFILRVSDHIFVQSEQMKRDLIAEGIAESSMTSVPSSVDLADVPYEKKVSTLKRKEVDANKRVVYLGTLKRVRKLDFIIRAFLLVLKSEPKATLFMIGKGDCDSDLHWLVSEAERLGIERSVVFTGFISMSEGWEYIRQADVCLSPYFPTPILLSTSPTKLVEYMAMGKPVVANDHPEQSLVLEESNAGICVPWDEIAFADAILKILADPDEALRMGLRGRAYVEQHRSNQVVGDVVEQTYRRILDQSRQRK